MRTNRCIKCWKDFEADYKSNVCLDCEAPKEFGFPLTIETVSLHTMRGVSKARLKELDKRVMLPDTIKGKDYVCGSMQKGKITDRQIDVRP